MVISSNTLFHFTRDLDDLLDILENCFTPRYCLENYSNLFHGSEREFIIAFPMTCFCDLPLSQLQEHLDFYGGYGIGLKKEWGIHQKINPVLYMHQYSDLSDCISTLIKDSENGIEGDKRTFHYLMSFIRHIKLYEGYVTVKGKKIYKKFYDEREWRWVPVPAGNKNDEILSLTEDEFNDPDLRSKADNGLAKIARLDFSPGDVKYIVVSSEGEINEVISAISIFNNRYNENDAKLLCTKILCSNQIKTDF